MILLILNTAVLHL